MTLLPQSRLSLLLLSTAAGLSYMLLALFDPVPIERFPPAKVASVIQISRANPRFEETRIPDLADLQQTVARQLFRATRRAPVPQPVIQAESAPADRHSYELVGVTLFGKRRVALIQASGGDRLQRISEGQRLDRWRVLRIEARRVVIALGDETRELRLKDEEKDRPRTRRRPTAPKAEPSALKPAAKKTRSNATDL